MRLQSFLFVLVANAVSSFQDYADQCPLQPGDDTCPEGCAGVVSLVVYVVDGTSTSTVSTIANTVTTTTSSTVATTTTASTTTTETGTPDPETTIVSCPGDHQSIFTGQSGSTFLIDCFVGIGGVELDARHETAHTLVGRAIGTADTFNGCIQLCDDREECEAVGYNPGSGACRGFSEATKTSNFNNEWIANVVQRVSITSPPSATTSEATSTGAVSTGTDTTPSASSTSMPSSSFTSSGGASSSETPPSEISSSETSSSETSSSGISSGAMSSVTSSGGVSSSATSTSGTSQTETSSITDPPEATSTSNISTSTTTDETASGTTSTSLAPSATDLRCPNSNRKIFVADSGASFHVDCENGITGTEFDGFNGQSISTRSMGSTSNFEGCIQLCDHNRLPPCDDRKRGDCQNAAHCDGVSWNPDTRVCRGWMNPSSTTPNGDWAAFRVKDSDTSSTSSSSSISSTSTASPEPTGIRCPEDSQSLYVAQNSGRTFQIRCDEEVINEFLYDTVYDTIEDCIDACGDDVMCVAINFFSGDSGTCFHYRAGYTSTDSQDNRIWNAIEVDGDPVSSTTSSTTSNATPSATATRCPGIDGQIRTFNGASFQIDCNIGVNNGGGRYLATYEDDLDDCIQQCASEQSVAVANYNFEDMDSFGRACFCLFENSYITGPPGPGFEVATRISSSRTPSSTTSSTTPSVSAAPTFAKCPDDDGETRTIDRVTFRINCNARASGEGRFFLGEAISFEVCMGLCAADAHCEVINYDTYNDNCHGYGVDTYSYKGQTDGVWVAKVESQSSASSTTTTTPDGRIIPSSTGIDVPSNGGPLTSTTLSAVDATSTITAITPSTSTISQSVEMP